MGADQISVSMASLSMARHLTIESAAICLMQLIKNSDLTVYYAFTVQEEVGLRGAKIAAYRISPQVAIAVDTTAAGEWPLEKDLA